MSLSACRARCCCCLCSCLLVRWGLIWSVANNRWSSCWCFCCISSLSGISGTRCLLDNDAKNVSSLPSINRLVFVFAEECDLLLHRCRLALFAKLLRHECACAWSSCSSEPKIPSFTVNCFVCFPLLVFSWTQRSCCISSSEWFFNVLILWATSVVVVMTLIDGTQWWRGLSVSLERWVAVVARPSLTAALSLLALLSCVFLLLFFVLN